jgi:hypothetical protein
VNKHTHATSNDMGALVKDVRALMADIADGGRRIRRGEGRPRLAAAQGQRDTPKKLAGLSVSATNRSKVRKPPMKPCISTPISL